MKNVCVFFANGYEEVEALTVVDILRRAGIDTKMVSINDDRNVTSSHNVTVAMDATFDEMDFSETQMLVLPGGIPGTPNLEAHEGLIALLKEYYQAGVSAQKNLDTKNSDTVKEAEKKYIAAICAAPSIFANLGFLKGKKACSHSSREDVLRAGGATVVKDPVLLVDNIIMSRGMGTAIDFGLQMVEVLVGEERSIEIGKAIEYR